MTIHTWVGRMTRSFIIFNLVFITKYKLNSLDSKINVINHKIFKLFKIKKFH